LKAGIATMLAVILWDVKAGPTISGWYAGQILWGVPAFTLRRIALHNAQIFRVHNISGRMAAISAFSPTKMTRTTLRYSEPSLALRILRIPQKNQFAKAAQHIITH
jgi:hypothetical protein